MCCAVQSVCSCVQADIHDVKSVEEDKVLPDPQLKQKSSRLRQARRRLAMPFTSGLNAFRTALSCVLARQ